MRLTLNLVVGLTILALLVIGAIMLPWRDYLSTLGLSNNPADFSQRIFTSTPLRYGFDQPGGQLAVEGVFKLTNAERQKEGQPALSQNDELQAAAAAKVEDMFRKQYFEHVSPQGHGPSYFVENAGYAYIVIGENLALGNFPDDAALVQAWMDSPGHRENILSPKFQEIGIAVKKGQFEGRTTWLAVQEFGTPSSACPAKPGKEISTFEEQKQGIEAIRQELEADRVTLETMAQKLTELNQEISRLYNEGDEKIRQGNEEIEEGNRASKQGDQAAAEAHWQRGKELQAEGEALLAQAQKVKTQADELYDEFSLLREKFNSSIEDQKEAEQNLSSLTGITNQAIREYNNCLEQYQ